MQIIDTILSLKGRTEAPEGLKKPVFTTVRYIYHYWD